MLKIVKLEVGSLKTNCYLLYSDITNECLIIDPGDETDFITNSISRLDLKPFSIVATHGHFDHILAVDQLKLIYKIPFLCSKEDLFLVNSMKNRAKRWLKREISEINPKIDVFLKDNIKHKDFDLKILETPGHTPGSICIYNKSTKSIITGDTIFAEGLVGRYDFSYSNKLQLEKSIQLILQLSKEIIIYPGHGDQTNIKNEKQYH